MHPKSHHYQTQILWTGNLGQGTSNYRSYKRTHEIKAVEKPPILGSSDVAFRGDASCYNPEELLVASLAACHLLWYLHLCAEASVIVTHYQDEAIGTMVETEEGGGHFTEVILRPFVTITAGSDREKAIHFHEQAHELCFIANSVKFPVHCQPLIQVQDEV